MSNVKITDLVSQETIDKIKELDGQLQALLATYRNVASGLASGIEITVKGLDDIEKLEKSLTEATKQATQANKDLSNVMAQRTQVIGQTTPVISRQLMEQERLNKLNREAYTETDRVRRLLDHVHDSYDNQVRSLINVNANLKANAKAQKENEAAYAKGEITHQEFINTQADLIAQSRLLAQEKRTLTQIMTAEEKAAMNDETSYAAMSQRLELLKKAYKELSAEGRASDIGLELENSIQNLDAHLKDLAADMGEFQRNVGNYAIAGQNGVVATESVVAVLQQEAKTIQDVADQTKLLQEAKRLLDTEDENHDEIVSQINEKLAENSKRLSDVSDIVNVQAKTVAEAEEQNKRFKEALKQIDLTAEDATEQMQALTQRIDENNAIIERATPQSEKLAQAQSEMAEKSSSLADELLSMVGINSNFGSSLENLSNSSSGSFIEGLTTKVKAFGKTLLGLLSNPWVLGFLGLSGAIAGFKFLYDYNKGLEEATKKTKDLTGATGDALKGVRNEVQSTADQFGIGFDEALNSANALAKQFGISMQDALGLIRDGFNLGADVTGEFLDNIREYPAYFKEAGLSASEFIAITAQANKAGIYSDKGIDVIKEGNLRLREMTKATREALEGIGISAKEVMQKLADGTMSTFDVMQMVGNKLKEFSASASEVGTAIADIFGGPGEDAGLDYIKMLGSIKTDLGSLKEEDKDWIKLQEEQHASQLKLNNAMSAMFEVGGNGFKSMTTKAKVLINEGLVTMLSWLAKVGNGIIDIINWWIRMYNSSIVVRGGIEAIGVAFKNMWAFAKGVFKLVVGEFKSLGMMIEGIFTGKFDMIKQGYEAHLNNIKNSVGNIITEMNNNTKQAFDNIVNGANQKEITFRFSTEVEPSTTDKPITPNETNSTGYKVGETDEEKKAREKAAKEAAKAAKEREKEAKEALKTLADLQASKIAMMAEGHDKEIAQIKLNYKTKIDAITGDSENEKNLRIQLALEMNDAIAKADEAYYRSVAKINLENRLATAKEGSKEELDLKLAQLQMAKDEELKASEKTGADKALIEAKYAKQINDLKEGYAQKNAEVMNKAFADETNARNASMTLELAAEGQRYAKKLKEAKGNAKKIEEAQKEHQEKVTAIEEKYAMEGAKATVANLEKMLNAENLSAEERKSIEAQLIKAKADLEKLGADQAIAQNERVNKSDEDLANKRAERLQSWLQNASQVMSSVTSLTQQLFDNKIEKLDEEKEALSESSEAEQARISELVEKKVITEEEGEARKRASIAKTAKREEQLEKEKQELKQRQAKWSKAQAIAQSGIDTALSIMASAKMGFPAAIPFIAIAATLGALQTATILATPLPKYAKGTNYHKGGLAIVGDGGQQEVVVHNNRAWLTPDKPTMVDIPKGAMVIPSVKDLASTLATSVNAPSIPVVAMAEPNVVVNNDYKRLEERLDNLAYLITKQTKAQMESATDINYELFKRLRT